MIRQVLDFVRSEVAQSPGETDLEEYGHGFVDAMRQVEEFILDVMWENGVDDDEEA